MSGKNPDAWSSALSGKKTLTHYFGVIFILGFLGAGGLLFGVKLSAGQENAKSIAGSASHGVDLSILDRTCKPCEDFYRFASGAWLKNNPIPPAYPTWGRFSELAETNRERLHQVLEDASKNLQAVRGSNQQKIGDFYASCMDEKQIADQGAKPLDAELQKIGDLRD